MLWYSSVLIRLGLVEIGPTPPFLGRHSQSSNVVKLKVCFLVECFLSCALPQNDQTILR